MGTKGNPHNNNAGSGSDSDSRWSGCSGPRERDRTRGPKRGPRKGASGAGASGARAARGPQRFAVTASGDTGLKLRIAALPRAPPRAPRAPQPPQPPHAAPAPLRRLRGRPRNEVGVAVGCASSSSSSSASASSSSSSSSSDSDSGDSAGGSANASSDDSSAALAAACSLQVIDDEDLAALLPEGGQPAAVVPVAAAAPFPPPFVAPSPQHLHDDKSIQDTGDGSSSEMEIPAQLVTAAIQRATADSSGSENEGCDRNAGGPSATHYASSLLRQFVAQTQLLNHSASMNQPVAAEPPEPPADEVADLRDCLLPPSDFLADEHLAAAAGRHLSPQQTEELRLINKDLAEIVSHANPADRTNFVNIDVSDPGSDFAKGDIKKSPAPSTEEAAPSRATAPPAARDGDCKRKRGRPRKTKEPPEVRGGAFPKEEKAAPAIEAIAADDFCLGADDPPNVSPDSGILSNHNSPARSPVGKRERKKEAAAAPARRRSASRRRRARSRSRPRDASPSSEASSSFGRKTAPPPPPALKVETPSPTPSRRQRAKKSDAKLDIAALDRMLYATDRVLYPPRRKAAEGTRGARGRALGGDSADSDGEMTANRSVLSEAYAKRKDLNKLAASTRKGGRDLDDWRDRRSDAEGPADDALDPTWRQIDLNPRFRDVLSGYRSDRDVKPHKSCSRLIESGYRSECGFRGGYRSDRGCRSGYKTDHRSGYRSDKSGYKSDRSVRSVRGGRKRMRKMKKSRSVRDRTYYKNQKYFVTDREILLLANKTFSCLTLGRGDSDSDSDSDYRSGRREVKFASACAKFRSLSVGADFGFGACGLFASASSERPSAGAPDPFAPGPVFGAFNARIPTSTINVNLFQSSNAKPLFSEPHEHMFGGSPALGRSPVFSHKFARSPMLADGKDDPDEATPKGGGDTPKRARSLRPEQKRGAKAADVVSVRRTDKSPVVVADAFRKARNSYVPSEALARNVFLNVRSPRRKSPASRDKKRRKRLGVGVGVVAGAVEPAPAATVGATTRPSRAPSVRDDRRRRHRGKRRRPSRSLSRPRDASVKRGADAVDPGFAEEVDGLSSRFAELCRVASEAPPPASADRAADAEAPAAASEAGAAPAPAAATPPATGAAPAAAAPTKSAKRASKKRKASDLADAPPPASKRRHKKQPAEGQSRGDEGDASANEHKLPLKKRHYHVNRSTAAGVASESADGLEADGARPADADADAFECTETDCRADGEGEAEADGGKRAPDAADAPTHAADADASSSDSDVKLQIPKPTGETSELSKKIYETSERLKAAHRLIHDLEKSLPKTERADGDESKTESAGPGSSPLGSKSSSAPIVTPKKRHRLEADRAVSNSPLDQVVQSLTKKLSEDRGLSLEGDGSENKSDRCAPLKNQESDGKKSSQTDSAVANDPIKSLSTRNLHKTPTVCVQKSDIMTRKKIRLEGLTSNLVSKINPNGATKTLDILINNNLRKSIESRTGDRSKENLVELGHKSQEEKSKARKDNSGSTPRATVIKSPISRQKLPAEAKKLPKGTEILIEETVVVEVEKPTGIFEPSVDIEMQIPKSSISLSGATELFGKNHRASLHLQKLDGKNHLKFAKENDIPPVLADGDLSPRKRSESIASLICDKIQESGHNLRQSKRSGFLDGDKKLEECPSEKKKKKPSNILRESKLSAICPQTPPPKILPEKMNPVVDIKKSDIENVALKCLENAASDAEKSVPLKKRVKRRKTINRTGFPSVKKKKKKISPTSSAIPSSRSEANVNSAFERVPEDGEATDRFLERTAKFKPAELKIVLKKEDYPKRSRLSVISLERLQGKRSSETEKREEPAPAEVSEDIDSDVELHLLGKTIAKRAPEETKPRAGARRAARKATPPSRETSLSSSESSSGSTCSRETSVDTLNNFRDRCEEPLPLNEKEEDVERSGDGLPKSGGRRRPASPRDDSPASSVDGFKTADKDRMKRNPRLRKKYLVAGLFSDYYKQNEPKPVDPKGRFNINLKDFPNGLLAPPPYCERWIRQRKRHFQLPYDVWWQRRYNQSVPSWNYRKIRTNVYYDVKPSAYGCESQACNCVPSSGCPDDCINRLVYSECTSQLCPCRELCKNQRIQKHDWSPGLEKFMTQSKGWGVRTKLPIKSGEFILEYVGEVVSDKEFKERMAWRYARDTHHYCLHLDGGLVIDGHRMGGDGRFVNHSCLPNCEMQKWSANGTFRMALFALRDIRGGEELTYDYNFSLFNPAEGQPCKCESNNCRGVIGGKSQRVPVKPSSLKSQPKAPAVSQIATSTSNATGVWSPSPNRVGRPRKAVQAKKADGRDARAANLCEIKKHVVKYQQQLSRLYQEPQMKPLTAREKTIARDTHCFLLKNLNKVRRIRDRASTNPRLSGIGNVNGVGSSLPGNVATSTQVEKPSEKPSRPSSRKPRSARKASAAAPADDRSRRLTAALKDIYDAVVAPNDEKSASLCKPLLLRQVPERDSSVLKCPPNLVSIRAVIAGGHYSAVSHFDTDMNALFSDVVRTDGRLSAMGLAALHLKKIYNAVKPKFAERLTEIIGPDEILPAGFAPKKKQEEVIMCICGLHLEEGLMVQCAEERDKEGREREREGEREGPKGGCGVWQHAHCMGVTDTQRPFLCHRCQPREVNLEIPLDEYAEEGHRFYLSLMRGDLQVRQGDTVYVLRDIPIDEKRPDVSKRTNADTHTSSGSGRRSDAKKRPPHNKDASKETSAKNKGAKSDKKIATKETDTSKKEESAENIPKHTYKTIGDIAVSELDIFRVERLWKHKDTGERFVYGHHYLRPHETYHEPTRKFFPNEVMRVPLYEAVPIDLVMSQCWVLDVNTYCKGRPVGAVEEHVYISELRVDRGARLFTKISRPKYPVCTKSYAFDTFPQRLKISRTYAPHEVSPEFLKGRGRVADKDKPKKEKENKSRAPESDAGKTTRREPDRHPAVRILPSPQMLSQNLDMQKSRLNGILLRLLGRLPTKRPLDVSYLLDGRRQRKKMQSS